MARKKMKIDELMQEAYDQLAEDRKKIQDSYDKFSGMMESLHDYAVNGQNINKCLELMTKQNAQFIDLCKLLGSKKTESLELDDEEEEKIYGQIKSV